MLSSKKFPQKSKFFRSRLMAGGQDAARIRDVQRLREHLAGQVVMLVLLAGFAVALVLFARAVHGLFANHGADLNPIYQRMSLGAILVCFLLVCRRVILRLREILELRRDLAEAVGRLAELRAQYRGGQDATDRRGPDEPSDRKRTTRP